MTIFTISVVHSIDLQTQAFLREISKLYTSEDLQATADLKARIDRSKARVDLIDQHLLQKKDA